MLDLLRRVAALTIVSAVGIGLLAPLAARSASAPTAPTADGLLAAADGNASTIDRGAVGRDGSAALTLSGLFLPLGPETLDATGPDPAPGSAPMQATLYTKPVPQPVAVVAPAPTSGTVSGLATWYCCTLGYRGEAVVALPGALGGHFDPAPASRTVTVCGDRCVSLPVVDYCGCHWGTTEQKIADLSPEAWAAVSDAPQSRGVIRVTIDLAG